MTCSDRSVLLAMSGGVDSSVAAMLLRDAGYDVTGVFLCLGAPDTGSGCCSPGDAADARRVAEALGIRLHVWNVAGEFAPIIDDFLDEYARGRTPNPCIHCNARIKFGHLVGRADALGIRYVATGHHARIGRASRAAGADDAKEDAPCILRARDRGKDQSYALFAVPRQRLGRILLPIGEIDDKARVRALAGRLGLHVHDKADSQEICFVPDDDYVALLRRRRPGALRPGRIVNADGEVVGRHEGYGRYTVGQRRGLGVAGGAAMYVTAIEAATATVTIGTRAEASRRHLTAGRANWHADVAVGRAFDAIVQVRYNHRGAAARVRRLSADRFEAEFATGVHAVAPGQAAVVYDGDRLLGGGWIE